MNLLQLIKEMDPAVVQLSRILGDDNVEYYEVRALIAQLHNGVITDMASLKAALRWLVHERLLQPPDAGIDEVVARWVKSSGIEGFFQRKAAKDSPKQI